MVGRSCLMYWYDLALGTPLRSPCHIFRVRVSQLYIFCCCLLSFADCSSAPNGSKCLGRDFESAARSIRRLLHLCWPKLDQLQPDIALQAVFGCGYLVRLPRFQGAYLKCTHVLDLFVLFYLLLAPISSFDCTPGTGRTV